MTERRADLIETLKTLETQLRGWPVTTCHSETGVDVPMVLMNPATLKLWADQLADALAADPLPQTVAPGRTYTEQEVFALLESHREAARFNTELNVAGALAKERRMRALPPKEDAPLGAHLQSQHPAVRQAVLNIRMWLVSNWRYNGSTIELDEVTTREIEAALAALPVEDGRDWRPIETAPKDGTNVLLALSNGEIDITNWPRAGDPLPDPPVEAVPREKEHL